MKTIRSKVNPRLLTKAGRLFTGTLAGRIIEVLQNARRAGATIVDITNRKGLVIVSDNGRGVEHFDHLLDLGGSGWDEQLETSEDPAGVGLFCLSPRSLLVQSRGQSARIENNGWTGAAVEVTADPDAPAQGTRLSFPDEKWSRDVVQPLAVFTGMQVIVDGKPCEAAPFINGESTHLPELGCRITIASAGSLTPWHRTPIQSPFFRITGVLVNFHGQPVFHDYWPVSEHGLVCLVEMTGEPTGIRLMLPARTQLVENPALKQLEGEVERAIYRSIKEQGKHSLPYKEYERARSLGIDLPEATPVFQVGLLTIDLGPEPIEVNKPEGVPLERCYRLNKAALDDNECSEANAHLLAALGKFVLPFVPVTIQPRFEGYSWSKLPTIDQVEVEAGKVLHEDWLCHGRLYCVESLKILARTSDGLSWESNVPMAVRTEDDEPNELFITPEGRTALHRDAIWYHLGGYFDEGDTYETQEDDFEKSLNDFWSRFLGPDEPLRLKILQSLQDLKEPWRSVLISRNGTMQIRLESGEHKVIRPPAEGRVET